MYVNSHKNEKKMITLDGVPKPLTGSVPEGFYLLSVFFLSPGHCMYKYALKVLWNTFYYIKEMTPLLITNIKVWSKGWLKILKWIV